MENQARRVLPGEREIQGHPVPWVATVIPELTDQWDYREERESQVRMVLNIVIFGCIVRIILVHISFCTLLCE